MRFHSSIRAALSGLDELARAQDWDKKHQVEARALLNFFTGPLIWHDIDEETSLLPRVRRRALDDKQREVLDEITDQHEKMEGVLERLMPPLEAACADPPPEIVGLEDLARELRAIIEPHLATEEQRLVPLARAVLTSDDLDAMEQEIAQRVEMRRKGAKNVIKI
jgi:hemerythrin-like domain-containing protein